MWWMNHMHKWNNKIYKLTFSNNEWKIIIIKHMWKTQSIIYRDEKGKIRQQLVLFILNSKKVINK